MSNVAVLEDAATTTATTTATYRHSTTMATTIATILLAQSLRYRHNEATCRAQGKMACKAPLPSTEKTVDGQGLGMFLPLGKPATWGRRAPVGSSPPDSEFATCSLS